jgi:TonB family protein
MSTAVANSDDRFVVAQDDELSLRKFLVYSIALHALLTTFFFVASFLDHRGNAWGGVGGDGAVKVNLVGQLAGIPMPTAPVVSESRVVDPTKGLYKEEPKPKLPEPKTDAKKIPKFEKDKPKPLSRPSRIFENKTPPPENAVPYGKGGTPNLPTGYSSTPGGSPGTVALQGQGGGDFAARYSWYTEAVKRRISGNWLQSTIDSRVLAARTAHAVVQFAIYRDGTVKDVHILQTSGNLSMDNSGLRAVLSSNPMPALPGDYNGSYVTVTFDFDLGMKR